MANDAGHESERETLNWFNQMLSENQRTYLLRNVTLDFGKAISH